MSKHRRTTPEEVERIIAMRNAGATYREIEIATGRPYGTIHRHINLNLDRITYTPFSAKQRGCIYEEMQRMGESERAALIAQAEKYGSTIAEVLAETWLDVYFSSQQLKDTENERTKGVA